MSPRRLHILLLGCLMGCPTSRASIRAAAEEESVRDTSIDRFPIWAMTPAEVQNLVEGEAWLPRVISFYAVDCGACQAEHRVLADYQAEHPEVKVVLVNLDPPKAFRDTLVPYIQRAALDGLTHVRLEEVDPVAALIGARPDLASFPSTLFVQPDGSLLHRVTGQLAVSELERWGERLQPPAPLR